MAIGKAMSDLVDAEQMNFLPRYGFQGSSEGLDDWNAALYPYLKDSEVTALLDKAGLDIQTARKFSNGQKIARIAPIWTKLLESIAAQKAFI